MQGLSPAPFAKLLEFDLFDYKFLVFGAPVVNAFAFRALQFYETVLGHTLIKYPPVGGALKARQKTIPHNLF